MRLAVALILLGALPLLSAAPVPKELRKPALAGTWEITGTMIAGLEQVHYLGHQWNFGADGSFSNTFHQTGTYTKQLGSLDVWFGQERLPGKALIDLDGDKLRIAFPQDRAKRATDFVPANNNVVYTFQRVKE